MGFFSIQILYMILPSWIKISRCTSTLLHFLITFLSQVLLMCHIENKTGQANTSLKQGQQTIVATTHLPQWECTAVYSLND